MDELTEILEKGIQAKRIGNYDLALQYIEKAREISPLDKRIFGNIFRIYIGIERYEDALRNLLIICCNNRMDGLIYHELEYPFERTMQYELQYKFRSSATLYKNNIFSNITFQPELIPIALKYDELLYDLIHRASNLTYYIGHSFIGLHPAIRSFHNIPEIEFHNLNAAVLGKLTGNILRSHKTAGLFLCIGFIFAHMNIKKNLTTKESIVSYYLNPTNKLNYDINTYGEFVALLLEGNMENKSLPTFYSSNLINDNKKQNWQYIIAKEHINQIINIIETKYPLKVRFYDIIELRNTEEIKKDVDSGKIKDEEAYENYYAINEESCYVRYNFLFTFNIPRVDFLTKKVFICWIAIEGDDNDLISPNGEDVMEIWDFTEVLEELLQRFVRDVGFEKEGEKYYRKFSWVLIL